MPKKLQILTCCCSAISFSYIAGHGDRGAAKLVGEAKLLCIGEGSRATVDSKRHLNRSLPNNEILKRPPQSYPSLADFYSLFPRPYSLFLADFDHFAGLGCCFFCAFGKFAGY